MKKTVLVTIALTAATAAWSQANISAPLQGDAVRASYGDAVQSKNTLTTTIAASTHIDDNALNDNNHKLTDAISNFSPDLLWDLTRQRWSLQTEYSPTFSYSLEIPRYNTIAHSLLNSLDVRLAQHLKLRIRNSFIRTSDPFGTIYRSQLVPGFGVLDQTNQALYGPPTLYTSDQAGVDLTYMPAAHTTVGVSGTYAVNYFDDLIASPLGDRDTKTAGGRAFIDQKLSPRQSVSLAYSYQAVTSHTYGRTNSHSVLLFDNWTINPKFNVSLFAGPQYIDSHQIPVAGFLPLRSGWSWSAGGTLGWKAERTGVSISAVHRVGDGGGIGGATEMTDISGTVSQKVTKKWSASFFASYSLSNYSGNGTSNPSLGYFSAGVGIDREIVHNMSLNVKYWYVHENQEAATFLSPLLADHNRVEVGLRYSFSRSLGR